MPTPGTGRADAGAQALLLNLDRVLMCPPTYFDIEYVINPYMNLENRVDRAKAATQWDAAHRALASLGVQIECIDPAPGLPDMTFAGDAGLISGATFLASNFRHPQRQGEVEHYSRWLGERGYRVERLPDDVYFEGLGDVIYQGNDILFGYGPRSAPEAIAYVTRTFPELRVLGELHLKDDSFYHTALAISLIGPGTVIYYPDAFTEDSRRFIERSFARVFVATERDAREYFVCNNIPYGRAILLDDCTAALETQLRGHGYDVIRCDMSEFKKSGGSIRCLILNL